MPLWKTNSNSDKQIIKPKTWTLIKFADVNQMPLPPVGWSIMAAILRIQYPKSGCPTTVKVRLSRWPNTPQEDETGHNDYNPLPGQTRHHHWEHFVLNRPNLVVGLKIWHDGNAPIILDGRQFKTTRFK